MGLGYFITGTDTGCGKTRVTLGLMHHLKQQGKSVVGMKPVASGAEACSDGLVNEDAQLIRQSGSVLVPYSELNPYLFQQPIAPHIAAEKEQIAIDIEQIKKQFLKLSQQADCVVVEGVGGWKVPLGRDQALSDLALQLKLPVILVVGVKLGCLNHAAMTAKSIEESGLAFAGWIGSVIAPDMLALEANLSTLDRLIRAPRLGVVPYLTEVTAASVARRLGGL